MSVSQMTQYRREHPEYYEEEKAKNNARFMNAYRTDEAFKQKMLDFAKKYYADPVKRAHKLELKRANYHKKKLANVQASFNNIQIAGQ